MIPGMHRLDPYDVFGTNLTFWSMVQWHTVSIAPTSYSDSHLLTLNNIKVVARPAHHAVFTGSPYTAGPGVTTLIKANGTAGRGAILTNPAPPFMLVGNHLFCAGVNSVAEGVRFSASPASPPDVSFDIWIVISDKTKRVAQLMDGD
jgi:hypothetical protein